MLYFIIIVICLLFILSIDICLILAKKTLSTKTDQEKSDQEQMNFIQEG